MHDISDAELIFKQNEESRNDVLNQTLGAETYREAHDACAGEDRLDIEAQFGTDRQCQDGNQNPFADTPNDLPQGLGPLFDTRDA